MLHGCFMVFLMPLGCFLTTCLIFILMIYDFMALFLICKPPQVGLWRGGTEIHRTILNVNFIWSFSRCGFGSIASNSS